MKLISIEEKDYVSAKELHNDLGIKRDYSSWIKNNIERAMLEENKDFTPFTMKSTGGRPTIDYLLSKDSAIALIIISGGKNAKKIRDQVIELYNQHDLGLAHTNEQIEAFIDLSRAMTLVSIQKHVEKKHFAIYNDKYSWYQYRAALLGYDTKDVIKAMQQVNKTHHSMRTSLMQLDANELIRVGIIDFMKALGKNDVYAKNVGDLCKSMAEKMKLGNIIWDDTKDNPLQINQGEVNERKDVFIKSIKKLNK